MWLRFKYLFDECFQQDDLEIKFDKNDGMYYVKFESNKVLCVTTNNYIIDTKESDEKMNFEDSWSDFEINVCFSMRQLRILYERYHEKRFFLSDIDNLESTEDSESAGDSENTGESESAGDSESGKEFENSRLVDTFIYRGRCFYVDVKDGYKRFIEQKSLPKYKLVYVYLLDPEDHQKIVKQGFIVRSRWKRYKKRNITIKYKNKIYKLSDFKPFTEYMTSLHEAYDYKKAL